MPNEEVHHALNSGLHAQLVANLPRNNRETYMSSQDALVQSIISMIYTLSAEKFQPYVDHVKDFAEALTRQDGDVFTLGDDLKRVCRYCNVYSPQFKFLC